MSYMITVFRLENYDHLPEEKRPRSISGGLATHSFDLIDEIKIDSIDRLVSVVKDFSSNTPFIFDDRIEVNSDENVSHFS